MSTHNSQFHFLTYIGFDLLKDTGSDLLTEKYCTIDPFHSRNPGVAHNMNDGSIGFRSGSTSIDTTVNILYIDHAAATDIHKTDPTTTQ